ncbi:MAG: PDGLE domain-containing protein [Dehalococcoidia bacterium]|nr:PDGLE domain-containing protein [Dehalococcoidia bacterium]
MKVTWWIAGYFIAIAITLVAPFASSSPDGLERVAEDQGFMDTAKEAPYAVIADYVFPGVENEALATVLAGVIGVTVIYLLVAGGTYMAYRSTANRRV